MEYLFPFFSSFLFYLDATTTSECDKSPLYPPNLSQEVFISDYKYYKSLFCLQKLYELYIFADVQFRCET